MIQVGNVLISEDVLRRKFLCDLSQCGGACCVEGDAGAPLQLEEIADLEEALPATWDTLSAEARKVIDQQGVACTDKEGDLVTSIVNNKDCVFTYHEQGCCFCALEKACREGKTRFYKPLSCHLYPIRAKLMGDGWGLNYHRWEVCRAAELKGQQENMPVYKFLREPLIRMFGQEWYDELELTVSELQKQGYL